MSGYSAERYQRTKQTHQVSSKKWASKNPDKMMGYQKRFHERHPTANAENKARWRAKYPERYAQSKRETAWRSIGIDMNRWSYAQYLQMIEEQNGKCLGCGRSIAKAQQAGFALACVDHDHTTGRVRCLLCSPCNSAMGLAGDNATTLRNLATILEK